MDFAELGKRVRAERMRRGLSAERLASAAGCTSQTVANVEKGERSPNLGTLANIACAMGMRAEDFLAPEPGPVDVAFELPAFADFGPVADVEGRLREGLEGLGLDPARFAVWPWLVSVDGRAATVPSCRRLIMRVPASSVVEVAAVAGETLPGFELPLRPPAVHALRATERLDVLVASSSHESAEAEVRHLASRAGCCPAVTVDEERPFLAGTGYLCTVSGLSAADSLALQRLPFAGPDGLFVPG